MKGYDVGKEEALWSFQPMGQPMAQQAQSDPIIFFRVFAL